MRIRAEKAFLFKGDDENIKINPNEVKDLPDWVGKTDLFKLAKKDGSVSVLVKDKSK